MRKINRCLLLAFLGCSPLLSAQEYAPGAYYQPTTSFRIYEVEPVLFDVENLDPEPEPCPQPECYAPKVYLEGNYTTGKFITEDEDYAGVRLFVESPRTLQLRPYLDLNGYRFKNGRWAASGGLGFEGSLGCGYCGTVNVFYDYRQSCVGPFHQIGVGLAFGNHCWTARFNGYQPLKKTRSSRTETFDFGDGFTATCTSKEYAYRGVDGELEFKLFNYCNFESYISLGGYYYKHEKLNEFGGGQARVGVKLFEYLTLECHASYDKIYHTRVQGIFSLAIPLDAIFCPCANSCPPYCDLGHSYRRNNIIQKIDCCQWDWNWSD